MRSELEEKQDVMRILQETANRLCQENHPAKQTVEVRPPAGSSGLMVVGGGGICCLNCNVFVFMVLY